MVACIKPHWSTSSMDGGKVPETPPLDQELPQSMEGEPGFFRDKNLMYILMLLTVLTRVKVINLTGRLGM